VSHGRAIFWAFVGSTASLLILLAPTAQRWKWRIVLALATLAVVLL